MEEAYKLILIIAGSVITVLLSVAGYFLKNYLVELLSVTKLLTNAIEGLTTTVEVIKTNQTNSSTNCSLKHEVIERRLNAHSASITKNGLDIAVIQTVLNLEK